jgi:glyoxylase-like metal-dependent hydrolase (beta-lactamase superfamily II)
MPIDVERILAGPPYGSNCYIVRPVGGEGQAAVIDPGGDAGTVLAALAAAGARLAGILVTHSDVDHVAAVAELAAATGAEVWVPAGEAEALRSGTTRGQLRVSPHEPEHTLLDGDLADVAGIAFRVVGVPGHSVDHLAFYAEGSLFSGDVLFAGSIGRTDLPGGDLDTLLRSIAGLLERFGPETTVYPGHGEPTTLGRELETNPFLGPLRAA